VWGGVLLVILGFWLGMKFAEERALVVPWVVGLLGAATLGLAGWHAYILWFQKITPDQKAALLTNQRRITSLALLGGGALLVILAVVLGFVQKAGVPVPANPDTPVPPLPILRANFGEAVGMFLLGLVALGTGWALRLPPRDIAAPIDLEPVRGLFPLIRAVLFGLGLIVLGVFLMMTFVERFKVGMAYFPELFGLLMFSMLCLAMALWLTSVPVPDLFATRVFVLVFGGATGLILFLMTLFRVIAWRSDIFANVTTWQGEQAWKSWLCLYLELVALSLMFGSLLLARTDVRANAVLRRMLFGYVAVLNGLLVLQLLIVLNIGINAMWPNTYSWTKTAGLHSLAEASKNLLHELKEPTQVYVLMSSGVSSQTDVRTLLENLEAESNKVKVIYASPDKDPDEYGRLAKLFPKILPATSKGGFMREEGGRGILIVYGAMPKDEKHQVPYAFIPDRKIYEETPAVPGHQAQPSRTFNGEVEVMKELNYLVHGGQKRKLYFLQGEGEIDIFESQAARRAIDEHLRAPMSLMGASMLIDKLKKDNYEIEAITFSKEYQRKKKEEGKDVKYIGESGADKKPELPKPLAEDPKKGAYAVVIAGASSEFSADALAAIKKYLDEGGKLMALFDIVVSEDPQIKLKDAKLRESGLENLVKKYGISSTDEFAAAQRIFPMVRPTDSLNVPARPPDKAENVLAKQFYNSIVLFRSARVIRPAPGGPFKAEAVFSTIPADERGVFPAVIAVRTIAELLQPLPVIKELDDKNELFKKIAEELPLVVAVSDNTKPRMVVFGDTEFISNLSLIQSVQGTNYSLFVSALEWMAERPGLIGPQPTTSSTVAMKENIAMQFTRIHLVPNWLMLVVVIGLGTGIWLVRRR
jgi:hypothetical protein